MNVQVNQEIGEPAARLACRQPGLDNDEQLVRTHAKLIKRIACSIFAKTSSAMPVEDLVQIGNIALLEAAATFEDRGTAQFSTYAGIRIRGAMIDELRRCATVSRQGLKNRRRFAAANAKLTCTLGRTPTDDEVARSQAMSVGDYRTAVSATQGVSYESIDSGYSEYDMSYADHTPCALEQCENSEFSRELARAIAELPSRQSMVLQLYFAEELDLATIGQLIDVGAARVCQVKKAALDTLRLRMSEWHH